MRIADIVITAAVLAGLSAPAVAQEGGGQAVPATAPTPVTNPVANPLNNTNSYYPYNNHWIASAFVGTNFGTGFGDNLLDLNTDGNSSTSINFGGQVAYLFGGYVGVEGLAEFSPSFGEITDVLLENKPDVNTYMANGIVAGHWGSEQQFMPYVSGGIGAVQLRSTVFLFDTSNSEIGTVSENGSRFGGDIGGGVMGFAGKWGFRGDVRYYKSSSDTNIDLVDLGTGNAFAKGVLSGLAFWKANVGVAFRW
jgi:hypothetical protein